MYLGAISTVFVSLSLNLAVQRMRQLGLKSIEIGTGGFFPKNHCDPARLLADAGLIDPIEGFELAVKVLRNVIVEKPPGRLWYE